MKKLTKTVLQKSASGKGYVMEITVAPGLEEAWRQAAYGRAKDSFGLSRSQRDLIVGAVAEENSASG